MRKMASMVYAGLLLGLLAGCSGDGPSGDSVSPASSSDSESGSGTQTDTTSAEPADAAGSGNR